MNSLKKILSVFLVVLMVLTSAPLEGLVGLELDFSSLFAVKAEAATSSTYLTSGFCGDTSDDSDGKNIS